ncbi:hypothetical protein ACJBU6_11502 [Exserohilum turcicum]
MTRQGLHRRLLSSSCIGTTLGGGPFFLSTSILDAFYVPPRPACFSLQSARPPPSRPASTRAVTTSQPACRGPPERERERERERESLRACAWLFSAPSCNTTRTSTVWTP